METTTKITQNEQIMQIFRKVMPLLDKEHAAQFEHELRELVPSPTNSSVMIKAGYCVEDKSASIHIFIDDEIVPPEQVADWRFDQIIPLWLEKADDDSRERIYSCITFMESCEGDGYEISGTLAKHRDYMNDHYIHFIINKK